MSREQKLSKKIAHTLLAMSIVYSGGMNVLCNTAFAFGKGADGADKNETVTVTDTDYTGTYTGNNGDDGGSGRTGESGGNGGGTFIELNGSANVSNAISFTATGGTGGIGQQDPAGYGKGYGGNGGAGGAATVNLTVSGADVTHADVSLTATGGAGNFAGNGNEWANKDIFSDETGSNGGDGGRAEASITVSGQKYTAADVTLSAIGGAGGNSAAITNGHSGNKLVADAEGNVAKIGGGGAGGSASAAGFVLGGSSLTQTVTAADVVITATGGKGGNNTSNSSYNAGATGGIGGAAAAYGIKIAALLPQEVAFTANSISVTATGGAGGATSSSVDLNVEAANTGGTAEACGIFNTDSAVKASATGAITVTATGGAAGNGGNASTNSYVDPIVARNGADGAVGTASGVRNINGHSLITANSLVVQATGGTGGNGGRTDKGAAYTNGADGGNGGNAYAYGVQSSGGTTELTVNTMTVTATGAAGGSGGTATGGGNAGTAGTISA